jgi:hypothetical protein
MRGLSAIPRQALLPLLSLLLAAVLVLPTASPVMSWSGSATKNTPICTASGNQSNPQIISDGNGGAIITWDDLRSDSGDIYVQKVDSKGTVKWMMNGVPVCTASGVQHGPRIISDGSGGAIVTWTDDRNGNDDIYAQGVDSSGVVKWAVNGVAISTASGDQNHPETVSDGSGGAIITWGDSRIGVGGVYAQRVDSSGAVGWTVNGVAICIASGDQENPQIVSDGSGGAIIAWDYGVRVYAQRVDSSGAAQWTAGGVCTYTNGESDYEDDLQVVSDGSGGAIITWGQVFGSWDLYAQRLDSSGVVRWTSHTFMSDGGSDPDYEAVSDGSGGVLAAWVSHAMMHPVWRVHAGRVDSSGAVTWSVGASQYVSPDEEGMAEQYAPDVVSDGSGGAVVVWRDSSPGRAGTYAQRVGSNGALEWAADTTVRYPGGTQPRITSDGSGGAIVTWTDARHPTLDVYAEKLNANGTLGVNYAAVLVDDSYSTNEDVVLNVGAPGVLANDFDAEGWHLAAILVSGPSHGVLSFKADGSFAYTPDPNYNGGDSFTYQVWDLAHLSGPAQVLIMVNAVNDPPSFAKGADQVVLEDAGAQTISNWATGISAGPSNESGQVLEFVVANDNNGLFSVQPAISASGTLTYTPALNANGSTIVSAFLQDNGGTETGGVATSGAQTFTISVTVVNDPPVAADDAASTEPNTTLNLPAPGVLANDADFEGGLTAVLASDVTHGALTLNADGSFTYTPALDYFGSDSFTYRAYDGTSYSGDATVTITVSDNTAPPAVTTAAASNVGTTSVRLNGDLTSLGTAGTVTVSFVWGSTMGGPYPNETTGESRSATGTCYFDLGYLAPGTTYYYRAKAVGDGIGYGEEEAFTTGLSPQISDVDPAKGKRNQHLTVSISGANFDGSATVSFGAGITVEDTSVGSSTEITVEIAIDADAAKGLRDVSVTTRFGTATMTDGFRVIGGGGGVCGVGGPVTPGSPSEMTTVLAALGVLLAMGYLLVRRGTRNTRASLRA